MRSAVSGDAPHRRDDASGSRVSRHPHLDPCGVKPVHERGERQTIRDRHVDVFGIADADGSLAPGRELSATMIAQSVCIVITRESSLSQRWKSAKEPVAPSEAVDRIVCRDESDASDRAVNIAPRTGGRARNRLRIRLAAGRSAGP